MLFSNFVVFKKDYILILNCDLQRLILKQILGRFFANSRYRRRVEYRYVDKRKKYWFQFKWTVRYITILLFLRSISCDFLERKVFSNPILYLKMIMRKQKNTTSYSKSSLIILSLCTNTCKNILIHKLSIVLRILVMLWYLYIETHCVSFCVQRNKINWF